MVDAFVRRWKLFFAVALGLIVIAITASLILQPVYSATASIRIDPTVKSGIDIDAVARERRRTRRLSTAR
uniref:Polysaccharide chain length determinant N-terminal domain-containing protein n=1 Tax=Phenylobacterium glaciei TaxID=2803784 RepID=A0A974P6A2_9CAUL|nr:hypothetical protein JKL49_11475 [Phenylobacterium glaciei]